MWKGKAGTGEGAQHLTAGKGGHGWSLPLSLWLTSPQMATEVNGAPVYFFQRAVRSFQPGVRWLGAFFNRGRR